MLLKSLEGKTVTINGNELIIDEMISKTRARTVKLHDGIVKYTMTFEKGEVLEALGIKEEEITELKIRASVLSLTTARAKQASREAAEKMRQFHMSVNEGYEAYNEALATIQA